MKNTFLLTLITTILLSCGQPSSKNPLIKNSKEIEDENKMDTINGGKTVFEREEDSEIVNKYWKLKTLEGQPVTMTENQEREQYFTLKSDGTITGFAGCNHFNGQYELQKGNGIRVLDNLAVTMKFCDDLKLNEAAFLEVFSLTDNYTINGDTLSLNVGRRAPLAVFEAVYF